MTSFNLILLITGVAGLQLAVYLAVAFWRHWLAYLALQRRAAAEVHEPAEEPAADAASTGGAWAGLRVFRVARKVAEDTGGTVQSFYLVPNDGRPLPAYRPGQFLTFSLEIPTATGSTEQVIRCYTLSDAPQADAYRISVKRVSGGKMSNFLHDHIGVGDELRVRAPSGHFHISQGAAPVVLIAGGIGITPALSMLNWCLANQPHREVWLFYGVHDGTEAIMLPHLEELAAKHRNFHLRLCFSAPRGKDLSRCLPDCDGGAANGQVTCHHRRIDITLLRLQLPLQPFHFYICGPTPMLESLVPALEDWGVPPARIHFEAFGPASIKRRYATPADAVSAVEGSEVIVTFARSGKQISWQPGGSNLLEFAEANGITINSGCRAGGCGSCQTTIQNGEVTYRQPPDYDPEPGTCLMCVCAPKSNVTLEA